MSVEISPIVKNKKYTVNGKILEYRNGIWLHREKLSYVEIKAFKFYLDDLELNFCDLVKYQETCNHQYECICSISTNNESTIKVCKNCNKVI